MATYRARINPGYYQVVLPDGALPHDAGDEVYLTEDEWNEVTPSSKANVLTLLEVLGGGGGGTNGLSAYELAVRDDGFVGTEAQWLASLKGSPGDPGAPGDPGTPGSAPQAYHHVQNDLAADWPVPHNLGYRPALSNCIDDAGTHFRPGIEHIDDNNLIAHFIGPCRGSADFS